MEVKLDSVSPIAFEMIRAGSQVRLQFRPSNRKEYREKIAARDCYLVFFGSTKIGMIPIAFSRQHGSDLRGMAWHVKDVDAGKKLIKIVGAKLEP